MNRPRVTFLPENRTVSVARGTTIAEAAHQAGVAIISPCNGAGTCGRCRVLLQDRGSVLACKHRVEDDLTVEIPATTRPGGLTVHLTSILENTEIDRPLDPLVMPTRGNTVHQRATFSCGLAVDIGTSTVAAELVDLATGEVLVRAGRPNSQASFGAEVTRRIEHVEDHGPADLVDAVACDLRALIDEMKEALNDVDVCPGVMVVAGNTAMLHFLYSLDPSCIRHPPHVPKVSAPPVIRGNGLGLGIESDPWVYALPAIGGWVGGDITAGILATGLHRSGALTLMIDIGTNGEIVLGNSEWVLACAASAGPAFEGCGISCGTGAIPGAIERVVVDPQRRVGWTTIGNEAPRGLCGSGLISAVAQAFLAGVIDRGGHVLDPDDLGAEPGWVIVPAEESATGRPIGLAQRDIHSVLRAKAAIFAGVQSLLEAADLSTSSLDRLILAGGFGSVLDPGDAIALGLIPDVDASRITFAGNTALRGARLALLQHAAWKDARDVACKTGCIELIDDLDYVERFTAARFIPHTDEALFPSGPWAKGRRGR